MTFHSELTQISLSDISEIRIGHESDNNAKTGVTVIYFPNGAAVLAAADLRHGKRLLQCRRQPIILSMQ